MDTGEGPSGLCQAGRELQTSVWSSSVTVPWDLRLEKKTKLTGIAMAWPWQCGAVLISLM